MAVSTKSKFTMSLIGVPVLAVVLGLPLHYKYLSSEVISVSVKDINKGDFVSLCKSDEKSHDEYDCNEYTNIDDMWWFKWNSGTLRAKLAAAMTNKDVIQVRVQGYRIEILSMRKNIVNIIELD